MSNRKQRIITQLAEARAYLFSVAGQIGPDQALASTENPAWNVHDLLAHLAGAERGLQGTVQRFLASQPLPADFSLDRWNVRQVEKQRERSVADLLASLEASRVDTLTLLESLSEEQLAVRGQHPAGFETSVGGIFRIMALHELDHGQEIALALGLPVEKRVQWT
ncbi:MAG TPA: maleylpyruvate isomerase family mycothiol-dependent enzyme [Anaerolineae bacterium]|nr:maleylpyruvate isomerase family mycothiol-dependent enzyme [Anaerolineae bacterium]HNU05301.1 maleylpyruvate isomerase family mycothiol-dependent enzyme [Anaerolineae bacterium]